ncbi:hypothetical protein ACFL1T_00905 [Chlamydiota bacterium]
MYLFVKYVLITVLGFSCMNHSYLNAQNTTNDQQVLEEFEVIDEQLHALRKKVEDFNKKNEHKFIEIEKQIRNSATTIEELKKELREFKVWAEKEQEKRERFEKELKEGTEIKGTITAPSKRYTSR